MPEQEHVPVCPSIRDGELLPVGVLWSLAMLDGKMRSLIKVLINRFQNNSAMIPDLKMLGQMGDVCRASKVEHEP